jgi:hypothetical protein
MIPSQLAAKPKERGICRLSMQDISISSLRQCCGADIPVCHEVTGTAGRQECLPDVIHNNGGDPLFLT